MGVGVRGFVRGVVEGFAPDSGTSQRGGSGFGGGGGGGGGGGAMGGTLVIRTRMLTMNSNKDQYNHS